MPAPEQLDEHAPIRSPHWPEAPADGQHVFKGPADLGGNSRCTACGAYKGSAEGGAPCQGRWAESGKMRSHAALLWRQDRAKVVWHPEARIALTIDKGSMSDKALDVWETGRLATREAVRLVETTNVPMHSPGVQFSSAGKQEILLACGHARGIELPPWDVEDYIGDQLTLWRDLKEGRLTRLACLECFQWLSRSGGGGPSGMRSSLEIMDGVLRPESAQ